MIALLILASFLHLLHCHQAAVYNPSGGPVYVNPDSAQAAAAAAVQQNEAVELVTQTVYGFLDFTTTIGNTVMVFSPQSAGAPDAGKKTTPATTSVIQTKPGPATVQVSTSVQEIKPSKTTGKPLDQKKMTGGKIASNVEVKAGPSATVIHSVVEVRGGDKIAPASPSVKVEVRSGPSNVVEVLSSKVEVREGNTVKKEQPQPSIKVQVLEGPSSVVEVRSGPSKVLSSHVEVVSGPVVPTAWSSVVEVRSSSDEPALSGNNIVEPEYDFLSRQPSEVVDETYRVINLRPSSKFHLKPRIGQSKVSSAPRGDARPTGLVTKLGGTVVKEGVTTVHETSVIGTYISGKYAQVLQSTSHIFHHNNPKPKPTPTSSLRILKTAAPVLGAKSRSSAHLDPTPAGTLYEETLALPLEALFSSAPSSNLIRPSRRPGIASSPKNSLHNRFHRNRGRGEHQDNREQELGEGFDDEEDEELILNSRKPASSRPAVRPTQSSRPSYRTASKNGFGSNRFGRVTSTPELATVSVFSETSATPSGSRRYHSSQRRSGFRPSSTSSTTAESTSGYSRRGYKPRVQASSAENTSTTTSSSLYKFKLSRPTGRWQYKTTPRPRVTIRKSAEDDAQGDANGPTTPMNPPQANARSDDAEQDITGSESEVATVNEEVNNEKESEISPQSTLAAETIKVEISTPVDFKDTYYEIATIKSPYTFQVGTVKNTRYITVTSTIEKSLEPEVPTIAPTATVTEPLTENILASTAAAYDKENNLLLETSIATLPPIGLAGDAETPPLETLTETFSTTQLLLKTHILPVIRGGSNTTRYTLIQSYHVTRLVTATKTLPPMEVYHFVPSKTLNEFNTRLEEAGSELHLELDVGDQNDQDDDDQPAALRALQPDIDLANIGSDFDVSDVDKSRIPEGHLRLKKPSTLTTPRPEPQPQPQAPALSPEQIQQLAFLRLLNPAAAAAIPQVITTSRPVLKVETVYESHVLPVINGPNTIYSTISRPVATVSKTEYEYGTSTLPALPVAPVNPLFPPQQQQFAITSTPVVTQTVVTETDSKVLKLTFGAKTAYTTLLSTKVVPTVLTTYVTASIPVQPTAPAFPGYFPAPYPQFPFVG